VNEISVRTVEKGVRDQHDATGEVEKNQPESAHVAKIHSVDTGKPERRSQRDELTPGRSERETKTESNVM